MEFEEIPNSFFYYASNQHVARTEQPSYMSFVENEKVFHVFNASTITLGRMANKISYLLQGKSRPYYAHDHLQSDDKSDFCIVVNGKYPHLLGTKGKGKIYRHHTGRPGSMQEITIRQVLAKNDWKRVVRQSVQGMLPSNKLREKYMERLFIYPEIYHDFEHVPQFIQRPVPDINEIFSQTKILTEPDVKIVYASDISKIPDEMKHMKYEPESLLTTPVRFRTEKPKQYNVRDKKVIKRFWKRLRRFKVYDHRYGKFEVK
jgi:large subunit ribosomal protein L13